MSVLPAGPEHFHPGVVSVEAFPPIPVRGSTEADIPALMERVARLLVIPRGEPAGLPL